VGEVGLFMISATVTSPKPRRRNSRGCGQICFFDARPVLAHFLCPAQNPLILHYAYHDYNHDVHH
jgi:hypothetical protein